MTEKPTNCQWCGAKVWPKYCKRDRTMFRCMATHSPKSGWMLGDVCAIRCVEQLRKLRTITADDVTPEQVAVVEASTESDSWKDVIVAAVKVMIGGVG